MVHTKVWVKHEGKWLSAVQSPSESQSKTTLVRLETSLDEGSDEEEEDVENSSLLVPNDAVFPRNANEDPEDDLIHLMHLNEPCILHELERRFMSRCQIYTWCGPILLAVNPYERLPLYTKDILTQYILPLSDDKDFKYKNCANGNSAEKPPHVFAIAAAAYDSLVAGKTGKGNQSILISGESGAGKTETTKFAMRFLATVSQRKAAVALTPEASQTIESKVLESNPILEAFGNAKTIRNDNSSRFGKFIQLYFDLDSCNLIGATVATYLLEKIRLLDHAPAERSFHIFYQLLAANLSEVDKARRGLTDEVSFTLINSTERLERDAKGFTRTVEAMSVLGFSTEERQQVLDLVAAVLHLGNLEFIHENDSVGVTPESTLSTVCNLLGIQSEDLLTALRTRVMMTKGEQLRVELSIDKVRNGRDALIKAVYSSCFQWVVSSINALLSSAPLSDAFIGILDIFGFETLEKNSLEQLCINYANERLQQVFNEFVLVNEQALYKAEKIKWIPISFNSNALIVSLLEGSSRKLGVFRLVDDEGRLPNGTDGSFARKLYSASFATNTESRFFATDKDKAALRFGIHHYAGKVVYSSEGFCSKNRDALRQELVDVLQASNSAILQEIFSNLASDAAMSKGEDQQKRISSLRMASVVSQFKQQLQSLIDTINNTSPHFVRCFKSNDRAKPKRINRQRLADQLKCAGVLEAVRVARQGFPVRYALGDFVRDFRALAIDSGAQAAPDQAVRKTAKELVEALGMLEESCQVGRSKVFMRHEAHTDLQLRLEDLRANAATRIQAFQRGKTQRNRFVILQRTTLTAQSIWRMKTAIRMREQLLQQKNATLLQKIWRCSKAKREYQRMKRSITILQAMFRRRVACRHTIITRQLRASVQIQRVYRGTRYKRNFADFRRNVVLIQCRLRVRNAMRVRRRYYRDASNVEALKAALKVAQQELAAAKAKPATKVVSTVSPGSLVVLRGILAAGIAQYLLQKQSVSLQVRVKPENEGESFGDHWYTSTFSEELKQLEEATLASPLYKPETANKDDSLHCIAKLGSSPCGIETSISLKAAAKMWVCLERIEWKTYMRDLRRGMTLLSNANSSVPTRDNVASLNTNRKPSASSTKARVFHAWKASLYHMTGISLADRWVAITGRRRVRRCWSSWANYTTQRLRLRVLLHSFERRRTIRHAWIRLYPTKQTATPSRRRPGSSASSSSDSPLFQTVLLDTGPLQSAQDEEFFDTENVQTQGEADAPSSAEEKIFVAIEQRSLDAVIRQIRNLPKSLHVRDSVEGNTPLGFACRMGDTCVDIVRALLQEGALPNIVNSKGRSALHLAAASNGCQVMECLLERNAEIWQKDKLGWTGKSLLLDQS